MKALKTIILFPIIMLFYYFVISFIISGIIAFAYLDFSIVKDSMVFWEKSKEGMEVVRIFSFVFSFLGSMVATPFAVEDVQP